MHLSHRARGLGSFAAIATAALATAPAALAGPLDGPAPSCGNEALSQPFLPWVDPASYVLAPGGSFETGAPGWSLSGGAALIFGNETYQVGGSSNANAMELPAGGSATSASACVSVDHPTLRLFTRSNGDPTSTLEVRVLFKDSLGSVQSATIADVPATSGWSPTAQIPIAANLVPMLPGGDTAVAFQFVPQGAADWQIDDVYIDPWSRG